MVRVVGETDISGLELLEAHLGLDWAAGGLDLTFPQHSPCSPTPLTEPIPPPHMHPSPCTELFSTKLRALLLWARYLRHAAPAQIPPQPRYRAAKTSAHEYSLPQTRSCQQVQESPSRGHFPSMRAASFSEDLLWGGDWDKPAVPGNRA